MIDYIIYHSYSMKIAICGPICSGKTYLSDHMATRYTLQKYAFGDKVKDIARDVFKMDYKDRQLIQTIADKMKDIDPDIWAKYLMDQIKDKKNIIIDDLRFPNELQYLQKHNFIIIKLTVDKDTQYTRLRQKYPDTYQEHIDNLHHNSEQFYDSIRADYTIVSNTHMCDTVDALLMNY